MRILYHSASPWLHTGYATCTEEIATRLHNEGHEVAIQCMSAVRKRPIWWYGDDSDCDLDRKMKVYDAQGPFGLSGAKDHFEDWNADLYFTHFDTWTKQARDAIPNFNIPYVSYVVVDHDPAPEAVVEQVTSARETLAMSKYAKYKLEQKGLRPFQIPHGVDTSQFYRLEGEEEPKDIEVRESNRQTTKTRGLEDIFLFGMIAANHGARKNIPNHMEAFKRFIDEVDDSAVLYLHTTQNADKGYNLYTVQKEIGIPTENIIWVRADDYGEVGNQYLNRWYNAFDVFLNCSFGESWGLTVTEAQAAGTPAIVTNFTSLPEQVGIEPGDEDKIEWLTDSEYAGVGIAEHGLVCEPSANFWKTKVDSKQKIVNPDAIFNAMKYYYDNQHLIPEHGTAASEFVNENYDWDDVVLPKFLKLFEKIEKTV